MKKIEEISTKDFHEKFTQVDQNREPKIQCASLIRELSLEKLEEFGSAGKFSLTSPADIDELGQASIIWAEVGKWLDPGSVNLTVDQAAAMFANDPDFHNMAEVITRLKQGAWTELELVSIFDTLLERRLIVDGVPYLVGLYYLSKHDPAGLGKLLESAQGIDLIEFSTPVGWFLFPGDFMPLYYHDKRDDELIDSITTFYDSFLQFNKRHEAC